jgi:hypothetical protein
MPRKGHWSNGSATKKGDEPILPDRERGKIVEDYAEDEDLVGLE